MNMMHQIPSFTKHLVSEPLISKTLQDYNFNTFPLIQTFEKDVTLEAGNYVKDKIFLNDGNSKL